MGVELGVVLRTITIRRSCAAQGSRDYIRRRLSRGKMMQSSNHPVKPRAMQAFLFSVRLLLLSVSWLVSN